MSAWPSSSLPRRPRPGSGLERGSFGFGRRSAGSILASGLERSMGWWSSEESLFAVGNIEHAQVAQGLTAVAPENLGNILGHSQI